MFFTRVKFILTFFTVLILGTFGSQKTGNASELEIQQEDVVEDVFLDYSRSFAVTSRYEPVVYRSSMLIPEMSWPTSSRTESSGYGGRESCSKCSTFHEGSDFTPGYGEPVYASMDGIVSELEYGGQYGLYIVIDHVAVINDRTERWQTVYAHLQKDSIPPEITIGSLVERGTVIAAVGNTGLTTGPHLHFEIRVNGEKRDPFKYLLMYAN